MIEAGRAQEPVVGRLQNTTVLSIARVGVSRVFRLSAADEDT